MKLLFKCFVNASYLSCCILRISNFHCVSVRLEKSCLLFANSCCFLLDTLTNLKSGTTCLNLDSDTVSHLNLVDCANTAYAQLQNNGHDMVYTEASKHTNIKKYVSIDEPNYLNLSFYTHVHKVHMHDYSIYF